VSDFYSSRSTNRLALEKFLLHLNPKPGVTNTAVAFASAVSTIQKRRPTTKHSKAITIFISASKTSGRCLKSANPVTCTRMQFNILQTISSLVFVRVGEQIRPDLFSGRQNAILNTTWATIGNETQTITDIICSLK
jgi:hypothetical protein